MSKIKTHGRTGVDKTALSRRLMYYSLLIAFLYLAVELLSLVSYKIITGQSFSFVRIAQERALVPENSGIDDSEIDVQEGRQLFDIQSQMVLHPYLGFASSPDRYKGDSERYYGIGYGRNLIHKRSSDKVIIGIFGGSVAAIFSDRGIQTTLEELAKQARFVDKEFTIVSAGNGQYKEPQQVIAFDYLRALGAEFDIVLNIDGFNEVALHGAGNMPKQVAAIYPNNWYRWAQQSPDRTIMRLVGQRIYYEDQRWNLAHRFSNGFSQYSVLSNLVWKVLDLRIAVAASNTAKTLLEYEPLKVPLSVKGPAIKFENDTDSMKHLVSIWSRCSELLHKACEADGIVYLHFLQPNQYVPDTKKLTDEEFEIAFSLDSPYRPGVLSGYPLLIEEGKRLRAKGIQFYDLTRLFSDIDGSVYRDDCCHYNARGGEVLGKVIAEIIVEVMEED